MSFLKNIFLFIILLLSSSVYADNIQTLDAIIVNSQSNTTFLQAGYVADSGLQATKVDTFLKDVPQIISSVTQSQMEDQQPKTLLEALNYSSGTSTTNFGFDSRYDAVYLRGFPAYYNGLFRDGIRQVNGPSAWYRNIPYTLEGVSILKGPSSSIYGVSGPGGLINMVSKRPKEDPFHEIQLVTGTNKRAALNFDFSSALNDDKTFLYRLTAIAQNADTPLAGYSDDVYLIAPAFTWQPNEDTSFTLLTEHAKTKTGATAGYYNSSYGVASHIYNGDPNYNDFTQFQGRIGYDFTHYINNKLMFRQNFRYSKVDSDLKYSGYYSAGNSLNRYWGHYLENTTMTSVDSMVEYQFNTGSLNHIAIAGVDYSYSNYDAWSTVGYTSANDTQNTTLPYSGGQNISQIGIYLHDQMLTGPWTIFVSGRYDSVDTHSFDTYNQKTKLTNNAFSGRLGASYRATDNLNLFANFSSSFSPNTGLVYDDVTSSQGRTAKPTRGLQTELGIKYEIPAIRSNLSASLFNIKQQDGVIFDTSTGINKQRQLDLHSQGLEIEGQINLSENYRLLATYTFLNMKIDSGATGTNGNVLSATPKHTASLWGYYEATNNQFKGLGIGLGVRYVGTSWGDDENTFKNKAQFFTDATISYDLSHFNLKGAKLQVNLKNIFNNKNQSCSAGYCYRYEGMTALASFSYRF